jgi:ribosomal protein S9
VERYFEGIGRRKTSTARVRIYKGDKASTINGVPATDYLKEMNKSELYIIKL